MQIVEKETITREEHTVKDCLCNSCGDSIILKDGVGSLYGREPFNVAGVKIRIHFGYGSIHDTDIHEFDLCDKCYDDIVSRFAIKPEVSEEGPFNLRMP